MTTIVHLLAIAFATAIAAALIYWLIRKYEPQLAKGVTAADTAFAQAHGLGPGCWPLPPRTAPFKIRVTYEMPTGCSLRAYLTGDAPARVSYGSATPTTENGDTYFTLPNGSGNCELSVSSPGVDARGVIMLVLVDSDGNSHNLSSQSSQSFNTVASVVERGRYITATNNPGRVRIRLSPSLYNAVADWTLSPSVDGGARLFASETGGSPLSSVPDVSEVWVSPGNHCRNYTVTATLDRYGLSDSSTFKTCGIVFEPVTTFLYNGRHLNPSHVIVGGNAIFRVLYSGDIMGADIYVNDSLYEHHYTEQLTPVSGPISYPRLPNDWGCTSPDIHYYRPMVDQPRLISDLLMFGHSSQSKADIPSGDIYGIWFIDRGDGDSAMSSRAPVGFGPLTTRNPIHK